MDYRELVKLYGDALAADDEPNCVEVGHDTIKRVIKGFEDKGIKVFMAEVVDPADVPTNAIVIINSQHKLFILLDDNNHLLTLG